MRRVRVSALAGRGEVREDAPSRMGACREGGKGSQAGRGRAHGSQATRGAAEALRAMRRAEAPAAINCPPPLVLSGHAASLTPY